VLLAALGLLAVGDARADGDALEVNGYVLDQLGQPVVGVEVAADNYNGTFYPAITDADGYYDIDLDAEANYQVQVSCEALTARGFGCLPAVAISLSSDNLRLDFVVPPAALLITNATLRPGHVGVPYAVQFGASGGNPPYDWRLAPDSPGLPAGMSLNPSGLLAGTPLTNSLSAIQVQVMDASAFVTNKVLLLAIHPRPVLSALNWTTNQLTLRLAAAAGQNYTIQMTTNLSAANWISLLVTNHANASSYLVTDSYATNRQRFYRVLIGP
jgi:hypothetical protein